MIASEAGFAVLVLLILIPLGLWGMLRPKESWRISESWKYKNPDAVEPSETQYQLRQMGAGIGVIAAIIGLIAIASANNSSEKPQERAARVYPSRTYPTIAEGQTFSDYIAGNTTPAATMPDSASPAAANTTTPDGRAADIGNSSTVTTSETTINSLKKVVNGEITVSNAENRAQTVTRYLEVTDNSGAVIGSRQLSVDIPAASSTNLDPTPYLDLESMPSGTYYWSVSDTDGSRPTNSGMFTISEVAA